MNDKVKVIGAAAFSGCTELTGIDFPYVTDVNEGGFENCEKLTNVNLPNAVTLKQPFMYSGNVAASLYLPKAETGVGMCRLMRFNRVELPSVITTSNAMFNENGVEVTILPKVTTITQYCGLGTTAKQKVVVLANPSVVTLTGTNGVFNKSTTVYVPESLIPIYQSATNWSSVYANGYCTFVAIEGSEYE